MKRSTKKKYSQFSIALIAIILGVISYLYYQDAVNFIENILNTYGYYSITIFAALMEGIPQLLSTDILILMGEISDLRLIYTLIAIIIGSTIGSLISFYLGRKFGRKLALIFIKKKKFKEVTDYIDKKGKYALPLISITPLPFFPVIFGVMKMSYHDFILYGLTTRALKYFLTVSLVFFLSQWGVLDKFYGWFGL